MAAKAPHRTASTKSFKITMACSQNGNSPCRVGAMELFQRPFRKLRAGAARKRRTDREAQFSAAIAKRQATRVLHAPRATEAQAFRSTAVRINFESVRTRSFSMMLAR